MTDKQETHKSWEIINPSRLLNSVFHQIIANTQTENLRKYGKENRKKEEIRTGESKVCQYGCMIVVVVDVGWGEIGERNLVQILPNK